MSNSYVYQGNIYCEKCTRHLLAQLNNKGVEDTGDSNDYPQGPYLNGGGEADSPQHCGNGRECQRPIELGSGHLVGDWLENPLTNEGLQYIANQLAENFNSPHAMKRLVPNFWRLAYHDDLMNWLAGRLIMLTTTTRQFTREFMDCDYMYSVDLQGNLQGTNSMCRWSINDDGHLKDPKLVEVPEEVMKSSTPEKMLREAIDEGAFDG